MEQTLPSGYLFAERYRIERLLARGGFGAVYVAEQIATEARVALKILWPHILGSESAVASFQQEARIAGRVNSDHIVRVLDAGFDRGMGMPFLVMELLEGEDLQKVVERAGHVSPPLVVHWLRQAASGLDKAHGYTDKEGVARPIVHRDLKPENLFLAKRESGEPRVVVLDFGIAKVMSATAQVSREVKGTPLYMAYEQASGGTVTPQTDVWALGLIAFFLLTGRNYWRAAQSEEGSLTQLFGEVLSLPVVAPSARLAEWGVPSTLPATFDAWFLRCVNRDPAQRYRTAGEATRALGEALDVTVAPSSQLGRIQSTVLLANASPPSVSSPGTLASAIAAPAATNPADFLPTLESARAPGMTAQGLAVSNARIAQPSRRLVPALMALSVLVVGGVVVVGLLLGRAPRAEPLSAAQPEAPKPANSAPAIESVQDPPVAVAPTVAQSALPDASPPVADPAGPAARPTPISKPRSEPEPKQQPTKPAQKPADENLYGER